MAAGAGGPAALRIPEGEEELEPGDVVCFAEGPEGAHKAINRRAETARIVIFSTKNEPAVSVYPDSDKVGVWPPGKLFRLATRSTTGKESSDDVFNLFANEDWDARTTATATGTVRP